MGFECGFEIAKKGNKQGYALYYIGNCGNFVDNLLMGVSTNASEDDDTLYIVDGDKLLSLFDRLTYLYELVRPYSSRVMSDFENYLYTGENFPVELKADYSKIKDALYNIDAEETDLFALYKIIPVIGFLINSEIFSTYNYESDYWVDPTNYELRYWRSY